ncbi:hypothetical protein KY284_008495 [Solanum tuberosum]|nr:hypothetical protein KY284_008495 [Solanum tuberosum]
MRCFHLAESRTRTSCFAANLVRIGGRRQQSYRAHESGLGSLDSGRNSVLDWSDFLGLLVLFAASFC